MTTIAVVNEKGGVGKTTTTVTLGAALAEAGHAPLLVGLDAQRDLTQAFGATLPDCDFADATPKTLARVLAASPARFTLIDCPPALGPEIAAALRCSNLVIIPLQPEALAVQGLRRLLDTLDSARDAQRGGNTGLQWKILVTMAQPGDADARAIEEQLRAVYGENVFALSIKRNPAFASSALRGVSVLQNAPRSRGAGVYRALAREIIQADEERHHA